MDQVRPDGRRRQGGQGGRREAFESLFRTVDTLPHLEAGDRETLRRNVEHMLRHGDGAAAADLPLDRLLAMLAPQEGGTEEQARFAAALRRCLEAHCDGARKIATYLHALQTLDPDDHVVEIDV